MYVINLTDKRRKSMIYISDHTFFFMVMKKNRKQVDNLLYRAKVMLRSVIGEEGKLLL